MRRSTSITALAAVILAVPVALSACSGSQDLGDASPEPPERRITVWSHDTGKRQLAGFKRIITGFTSATGIGVDLVPVESADVQGLLDRSVQGRSTSPRTGQGMPDVVGALPLAHARVLAARGLIDTGAVAQVLGNLGRDTFQESALRLASQGSSEVAVPSDAWTHVLVYRRDLFDKAGLPVPDTFSKLRKAADRLDTEETAGIVLPSATGARSTARTFEHLALANGCRLSASDRTVSLDSPECIDTFAFYARLAAHGPEGAQSARDAREAYLAGEAAMLPAPSAVLDDLAGLDAESSPTCEQCASDSAFLAKNSGVVTAIRGPHGTRPVQYGVVSSWTITTAADSDPAKQFVAYMMNQGYLEWLGVAPGGNVPVRQGTADEPEKFTQAWATLPAGSGNAASLSSLYSPTVLDLLESSTTNMRRWGTEDLQGSSEAVMRGSLPIATHVHRMLEEDIAPALAAKETQRAVQRLLDEASAPVTSPP